MRAPRDLRAASARRSFGSAAAASKAQRLLHALGHLGQPSMVLLLSARSAALGGGRRRGRHRWAEACG